MLQRFLELMLAKQGILGFEFLEIYLRVKHQLSLRFGLLFFEKLGNKLFLIING